MFSDWWYEFKCKYWHKYNQVTAKALPPTYTDRCELLPHVMFQILTDFLEKEDPFRHLITFVSTDEALQQQAETFLKLIKIYNWYWDVWVPFRMEETFFQKKGLGFSEAHKDSPCTLDWDDWNIRCVICTELFSKRGVIEEELYKELNSNLHQLIDLHRHLWT